MTVPLSSTSLSVEAWLYFHVACKPGRNWLLLALGGNAVSPKTESCVPWPSAAAHNPCIRKFDGDPMMSGAATLWSGLTTTAQFLHVEIGLLVP